MRAALAILLVASPGLAWGQQATDLERLATGLPKGFRRPAVQIQPIVDQRGLFGDAAPSAFWAEFSDALGAYANLNVSDPAAVRAKLTRGDAYKRRLAGARAAAKEGQSHYRNVRLPRAAAALESALAQYAASGHASVDRAEVGKVALAHAQALLEAGDRRAGAAFERALEIDPTLRLRAGFDRPEAVAALNAARAKLAAAPPAPPAFTTRPNRRDKTTRIYGRMLPGRVEVAIHTAGAIRFESQSLSAPDAAQRLASRVWACLPFGRAPHRARLRQRLAFDVGFTGFSFLEAPVGTFINLGVGSNFSWLLAEHLSLDGRVAVTVSGRDNEQDLRRDVPVVRAAIAPGGVWGGSRWRGMLNIGIEGGYLGDVVVTTIPACKHFDRDDGIPPAICKFDDDIERTSGTFVAGPILTLGGSVRLVDQIYFAVRAHGATWLFESNDTGLGLPVGVDVALGYRLF